MSNSEKTIIPLDEAQEMLSAFGIDGSSVGYQRWARDDGFRQVDLEDVLNESSAILIMDWRGELDEAMKTVVQQLSDMEIDATLQMDDDGTRGTFTVGAKTVLIKYVPSERDNFEDVMVSINSLIQNVATYRKFRSYEGSDTWGYAVLKNEDWRSLEASTAPTVRLLFV